MQITAVPLPGIGQLMKRAKGLDDAFRVTDFNTNNASQKGQVEYLQLHAKIVYFPDIGQLTKLLGSLYRHNEALGSLHRQASGPFMRQLGQWYRNESRE